MRAVNQGRSDSDDAAVSIVDAGCRTSIAAGVSADEEAAPAGAFKIAGTVDHSPDPEVVRRAAAYRRAKADRQRAGSAVEVLGPTESSDVAACSDTDRSGGHLAGAGRTARAEPSAAIAPRRRTRFFNVPVVGRPTRATIRNSSGTHQAINPSRSDDGRHRKRLLRNQSAKPLTELIHR